MTCDSIHEKIPQLIRRELTGFDRVPIINHLHQCSECLKEYRNFLKMYYSIDWEIVSSPVPLPALDVYNPTPEPIQHGHPGFRFFRTRSFYATAAVLILIISVSLLILNTEPSPKVNSVQNQTAPPGKANTIPSGTSGTGFKDIVTTGQISAILDQQTVPVYFLEQQLLALQNRGIDSFHISQVLSLQFLKESSGFEEIGTKSIPVSGCLDKLKNIRRYKSQLTFSELVSFVNTITDGGV